MKLGERQSLGQIYFRWTAIFIIFASLSALAVFRYNREVAAISPDTLLRIRPEGMVRLLGRVAAGTLNKKESVPTFTLSGESISDAHTEISVRYIGKQDDNLRERKLLVAAGFFDPGKMEFAAQTISPIPNIGFVVSAYLLSLLPLMLFLFHMERNVILLSILIKEEKGYQPEEVTTPEDVVPSEKI